MPLWITTTSAKGDERVQALVLLDHLQMNHIKNNKLMTICEADKGYDSDSLRHQILRRGYLPIIGYRKNRRERVSTEEIYKCFKGTRKRWVVERCFSWLKRKCRRLLMRWERLPEAWNAFALLGLIFMWMGILLG